MVLLNTLAIVAAILVGVCFVVDCTYGLVKSWIVLMIDSSIGYRILVSLLCVLTIVLLAIFFLALIAMFGY